MRRLTVLTLILGLLLAVTFLLWQHRFKRVASLPGLSLSDLAGAATPVPGARWEGSGLETELILEVDGEGTRVSQRLALDRLGRVDFLMADFQVEATGLVPGRNYWEDGRVVIEWRDPEGNMDLDYLVSMRGTEIGRRSTLVSRPATRQASVALRVEHLGKSGAFRMVQGRFAAVEETAFWRYGRWLLFTGWLLWATAVAGWGNASGLVRPLFAAAAWTLIAHEVIFPGPWRAFRSLVAPFEMGAEKEVSPAPNAGLPAKPAHPAPVTTAGPSKSETPPWPVGPKKAAAPLASVGKLPPERNLLLRLKYAIKGIRPLLHVILFFAPALFFALLVGRKRSLVMCAILAGGTELAQLLFGYGATWEDLGDVVMDGAGVGLAFLAYRKVSAWPLVSRILPISATINEGPAASVTVPLAKLP